MPLVAQSTNPWRELRTHMGLSQHAWAAYLGVSLSAVTQGEAGAVAVPARLLSQLAARIARLPGPAEATDPASARLRELVAGGFRVEELAARYRCWRDRLAGREAV